MNALLITAILTSTASGPWKTMDVKMTLEAPEPYEFLIVAAEIIPASMLSVFIHESGHALAATMMGLNVDAFQPYPGDCGGTFSFGCTITSGRTLSLDEQIALSSAGIIASRFSAESIDLLMDNVPMPKRVKQFGAIMYFAGRFDSVRYIFRCAFAPCEPSHDTYAIARSITTDIDEIELNWKRMWMVE
jgi:hypothetical protein